MRKLYERFNELKKIHADSFSDNIRLVKFERDDKLYEIYFTKKRANKYSIIHCKNNTIEWEQFPVFPRLVGSTYSGHTTHLITLTPSNNCIRIFVISGKPNCITGLDEGVFRSVHKYDENYINVMSESRFKELYPTIVANQLFLCKKM